VPLWARSSVPSPLVSSTRTRPCGRVLVLGHYFLPPGHEERDPRVAFFVSGMVFHTPDTKTRPQCRVFVSGISLHPCPHPLHSRYEERDPRVAFFVSGMLPTPSLQLLRPRREERDRRVAFFVSAPIPPPSTTSDMKYATVGSRLHVWGVSNIPDPHPTTLYHLRHEVRDRRVASSCLGCLHPSLHLYRPDTKNATMWSRSSRLAVFPQQALDPDTENATNGSHSPCLDFSPRFSFNPDTKTRRVFVSGVFPYLD